MTNGKRMGIQPHIRSPRSRREFLVNAGAGFGAMALSALLAEEAQAGRQRPFDPRMPHIPAKARSVIWLFMEGGPSHIDLFDPKPALQRLAGQPLPASFERPIRNPAGPRASNAD